MYVTVQTEKSTPIWTIRAAICDGHLPQRLFNKYEKQSAKLVNALADRKLTNIEAQRVVRILEVLRRRVLLMGLLDDMLTNTDDYEQILTHSALNILEEIRIIKDTIKQLSRSSMMTSFVSSVSSTTSSSSARVTTATGAASAATTDKNTDTICGDLTPLQPSVYDEKPVNLSMKPTTHSATQPSSASHLEAKQSLGSLTFSSSTSNTAAQPSSAMWQQKKQTSSKKSSQDIAGKFQVLPPINQSTSGSPENGNKPSEDEATESQTAATSDGNKIVSRDENKYDQVAPEDKKDELKHDEKDINLGEVPAINKTPAQSRSIKEKQAKLNTDLERKFKNLLREFASSGLFDYLEQFNERSAEFSCELNELFYKFARILLERLLTTSDEEFIMKHFIQGLYERIELNRQLTDAKIDNLVSIKESEKEEMDVNDLEIENNKDRMAQLEDLRSKEIQNIIQWREDEEAARVQNYEQEMKNETTELENMREDLKRNSEVNRKKTSKTRYEIEDYKEDIAKIIGSYDSKMTANRESIDQLEIELDRRERMKDDKDEGMKSERQLFEQRQAIRNEMIKREFYRMNRSGNMIGREWRGYLLKKSLDVDPTGGRKKKKRGRKGGKKGGKGKKKGGAGVKKSGSSPRKPILRGLRGAKKAKRRGKGKKKGKRSPKGKKLEVIQEVDDDLYQDV
ncbi:uncharacterized protein LOC142341536 isoform X2 [Convolutriloba macropyga]|uniref:uncharacterized protein LOC142341536 isoform X2 n=1 Tax=Convolutriloba macropyga TaxID=536237 RepID=UPI003F522C02